MLNALALEKDVYIRIGILSKGNTFRPGYDWDNQIDNSIYIKLFEDKDALKAYSINDFDFVGVLGVFGSKELFKLALKSLLWYKKEVFIFSEGLKQKTFFNKSVKRLTLLPLNNPKVSLFLIGADAYPDYYELGMNKCQAYQFGFSVPSPKCLIKPTLPSNKIKLIYIGQLIERKRVFDLIKAIAVLKDKYIELSIIVDIFGEGIMKNTLQEYIDQHHLEILINLRGQKKQEELYEDLPNYDCLILPSQYDGWGAVVNEAMQSGLAVIVSQGVRARQIVEHGVNGYQYPTGNIEELVNHLEKLILSPEKLRMFKENSILKIQDYSPETLAQRLHEIASAKKNRTEEPNFKTSLKQLK